MSEVTYTLTIEDQSGIYVSCTDDFDHLGEWLIRTIQRMNASNPVNNWHPRITHFSERRL